LANRNENEERLLQALLTEYQALRAEILHLQDGQRTPLNFHLTALAAVTALALTEQASVLVLLIVPSLCTAFGLSYLSYGRGVRRLSTYIQTILHPIAVRLTGSADALSWESVMFRMDEPQPLVRVPGIAVNCFLVPALIVAVATFPSSVVDPSRHVHGPAAAVWPRLVWCLNVFALVGFIVLMTGDFRRRMVRRREQLANTG
jgi:hypothetical protein